MNRAHWEWKLKAINLFCQIFFFLNAVLTIIIGFGFTIPDYCGQDGDCQYRCKILAWYLFLNSIINYACVLHKSKLSIVTKALSAVTQNTGSHSLLLDPSISQQLSRQTPVNLFNNNFSNNGEMQSSNGGDKVGFTYSNPLTTSSQNYNGNSLNQHHKITPDQHSSYPNYPQPIQIAMTSTRSNHDYPVIQSSPSLAGWTECRHCNVLSPPRAKHCPLCGYCVLKRDHHCFFAGCCIGFYNQRFFTIFCLHTGLGCAYSVFFISHYLRNHFEAGETIGYAAYFPPFLLFLWLFGYTSIKFLGLVVFFLLNIMTAFAGVYYFIVQMVLTFRGQTKYEFERSIHSFRGTLMANIRSVFGEFFPLNFLVPIPMGGYRGDGINWDDLTSRGKLL